MSSSGHTPSRYKFEKHSPIRRRRHSKMREEHKPFIMSIFGEVDQSNGVKRTRSQAIPIAAIPAQSHVDYDGATHSGSSGDACLYDLATWQMYHRIVSYRQRNPLSQNKHQSSNCAGHQPDGAIIKKNLSAAKKNLSAKDENHGALSRPPTRRPLKCFGDLLDDEIFELDL